MIIRSINGTIIYHSKRKTLRQALEEGVERGIDFSGADLRRARLSGASLDGMRAAGASMWGADLTGTDIGLAELRGADMRCANLKDTCLAETDLAGADLTGAYFSRTLLAGAILDKVRLSCPSFWDTEWMAARSHMGAVFLCQGEREVMLSGTCAVINIRGARVVLADKTCIWNGTAHAHGAMHKLPAHVSGSLQVVQARLAKTIASGNSQNATNPDPKNCKMAAPFYRSLMILRQKLSHSQNL